MPCTLRHEHQQQEQPDTHTHTRFFSPSPPNPSFFSPPPHPRHQVARAQAVVDLAGDEQGLELGGDAGGPVGDRQVADAEDEHHREKKTRNEKKKKTTLPFSAVAGGWPRLRPTPTPPRHFLLSLAPRTPRFRPSPSTSPSLSPARPMSRAGGSPAGAASTHAARPPASMLERATPSRRRLPSKPPPAWVRALNRLPTPMSVRPRTWCARAGGESRRGRGVVGGVARAAGEEGAQFGAVLP